MTTTDDLPFYGESKARKVALRLLELGEATRKDLAEYAQVSDPTVNRVVADLREKCGYTIERTQDQERFVHYKVLGRGASATGSGNGNAPVPPSTATAPVAAGDAVELLDVDTDAGRLTVAWGGLELSAKFKGRLPRALLRGTASVVRISPHPSGFLVLHVGDSEETLPVRVAISKQPIG